MKYIFVNTVIVFTIFISVSNAQIDSCECEKLNKYLDKNNRELSHPSMDMPAYIGGNYMLLQLINNPPLPANITDTLSGSVMVGFVVDTSGNVGCYKIAKKLSAEYDAAALKFIKRLQLKFTPGKRETNKGWIKEAVGMVLPIMYKR